MVSFWKKWFPVGKRRGEIIIVSGVPRSGTSMMMKMLEAGGIEVLKDDIRKADEDNPRGYYEFERVKQIKEDQAWLESAKNKAVKMVSMLLLELPPEYSYRVVFMKRDFGEMLASQRKMLERNGKMDEYLGDEEMGRLYQQHLREMEGWLEGCGNFQTLYASYNQLLEKPREQVGRVNHFLGGRLDEEEMVAVIDRSLYRNRN